MDLTSHAVSDYVTRGGAWKDENQSGSITRQPTANRTPANISSDVAMEAPPPLRSEDADSSNDSLIDSSSRLLPALSQLTSDLGVDGSAESPPPSDINHGQKANQKRLHSTKRKTNSAHIKEVAGDGCCVHCLLACLYCELLSMCSAVGACLECGVGGASCCDMASCCCCCVEACEDDTCTAVLDCAVLEDCCCASADCLEICLECCSICFPS
ncbi:myoD family inhibitor domain-containing protein-like [Gouania willdenowi]|uniref:myoD family inhibitor domain-containing protein-like n=1 Tax=Gouania willdenowi TaxID=441366 RepID=UPI001054597D|nr:myoD family inhibitor domain-containing protein-like [Gouania willdenowi]